MGKKVAVTKEERTLSYYKYFERPLAGISAEKLALMENPSEKPIVPFEEKDRFLSGRDDGYCQAGYGVTPDGIGFACNTTYFPGVTGEMLDWWFPWHSVGSDLRYKVWDPEDHYFARADKAEYVLDPDVPNCRKTWGVGHYIREDIGTGPSVLKLNFMRPADYGYDETIIGTEKCASLVCAVGEGECIASTTHKWYPYRDGVMFCSRFWIGYGLADGKIARIVPEGARVPEEVAKGLFAHCVKEFTNLGSILPEIYAENKDNF